MSKPDPERTLQQYEDYLQKGEQGYRAGNLRKAREYFLLAAERLYDLADIAGGELGEERMNSAEELVNLVEQIDAEIEQPPQAEAAETGREEPGAAEEAKNGVAGFVPVERPDIRLDDVAGLDDLKKLIREKLIDPFLFPDMYEEFGVHKGGGILLYGPPGTGKTLLARAVAGEVGAAFFPVLPGDILSKWVGEPEKNIRSLFDAARQHERAVIFFDELDALAVNRQRSEDYMRRLVNQLLAEIQGFSGKGENALLVMGATNHPSLLDHAMLRPGRFDELVYVPLPDQASRAQLWKLNLSRRKRAGRFDYKSLAQRTDGFSGAEIAMVCDKASRHALDRCKAGDEEVQIEMQDVETVLEYVSSRTSAEDLEILEQFADRYDRNRTDRTAEDRAASEQTGAQAGAIRPEGIELERMLDALLEPFPQDEGLVQGLVQLFKGWSVARIYSRVAAAVTAWCGDDGDWPDEPLGFGWFLRDTAPEGSGALAVAEPSSVGAVPAMMPVHAGNEPPVPQQPAVPYVAGQDEDDPAPAVLSAGEDILDRYRAQIDAGELEELRNRLYAMADAARKQGAVFDALAFEQQVLLTAQKAGQQASARQEPFVPADLAESGMETRQEALRLLQQVACDLTPEDLEGLSDEVRQTRQLNLESFRTRVLQLAAARLLGRNQKEFNELLEERREWLTEEEILEIQSALEQKEPDFAGLKSLLHQKTFQRRIEKTVDEAVRDLALPNREIVKIKRKVIRSIIKSGESPTVASVRTRVQTTMEELKEMERHLMEKDNRNDASIEKVDSLVLEHLPYDLTDVAGMGQLKQQLESAVEIRMDAAKRKIYADVTGETPENTAVLMYGSPGCGKTFLALAAAGEFAQRHGFTVIHVPARAISGIHYSKHTPRIAEIFNLAQKRAPSIVIWDEFDAIAESPVFSGRKHQVSVCTELKTQFEGVIKSKAMVIHIATSNYPWQMEPALMRHGRMGSQIHVTPPDFEARKELLEIYFGRSELKSDRLDFDRLAEKTDGMTTVEVRAWITGYLDREAQKLIAGGKPVELEMESVESSLAQHPPRDFRTWLTTASRTLSMPRYQDQRQFFPELLTLCKKELRHGS